MSLFNTIAHGKPMVTKGFVPRRRLLVGIAVAVGVGLAAASISPMQEVDKAQLRTAPVEFTNARFIELNTIALDALAPVSRVAAHNSFLYWNVGSLENVAPLVSTSPTVAQNDYFLYWNTELTEYPKPVHPLRPKGPR